MLRLALTPATPPLAAIPPRVRRAAAQVVSGLAFDVRDALRGGMRDAFDRPKPFTLNAFRVTGANAGGGDADIEAVVWAMPMQAKYLRREIEGGERDSKAFEHKLRLTGGRVAVPTAASRLDQFGNMPLSFIRRVTADQNTGGTAKRFFAGTPKGMPGAEGVWARVDNNRRLVPLMRFADDARYSERFQMSEIAGQTVNARFESQLLRAMARQ